jgi:hypothetical protein
LTGASSTGSGGGAEVATGTGWATLKGSFKLAEGVTPRPRKPLIVNKDTAVCAPGGKSVLDEVMLVDSATRGIANIAVFVRRASRVHESAQAGDQEVLFDQKACIFLSHVFPLQVGQTMSIKNSDPVGHNTNIVAQKGVGFNQTIPAEQALTYSPTAEENMPISVNCSIHPWMQAYLLPRKNGYFAVSKPDGSFEIADLPAGEELEFQVWHENAAGPGGALGLERKDVKWTKKGRFRVTLKEDEERVLDVVVPGSAFKG